MLPVKPSVTIDVGAPDEVAALDVADELERVDGRRRALAQLPRPPRRRARRRVPASSPLDSSPTRGRSHARERVRQRRAHERELHQVLGAHLGVGADVEQRHRMAGTGSGIASAGR